MNILLTGGAGYIGSHTCIELISAGHKAIMFFSFTSSGGRSQEPSELI